MNIKKKAFVKRELTVNSTIEKATTPERVMNISVIYDIETNPKYLQYYRF
jgi:hypothetical protein